MSRIMCRISFGEPFKKVSWVFRNYLQEDIGSSEVSLSGSIAVSTSIQVQVHQLLPIIFAEEGRRKRESQLSQVVWWLYMLPTL